MPLTLDEIVQYQERLQAEIVERECLLASLTVLQKYAADGNSPKSFDLRSALPSSILLLGASAEQLPAPLKPPPPAEAPKPYVKPYIHPELQAIGTYHGRNSRIVSWAIQRMTADYSLHDIQALLEREGGALRSAEISVVLTRMKGRGQIEEIKRGSGPIPAVFRTPEDAISEESQTVPPTEQTASAPCSAAAQ
jgi:hypothetical protein